MDGGPQPEKSKTYPTEDFEQFIVRCIFDKKREIRRYSGWPTRKSLTRPPVLDRPRDLSGNGLVA
jgi:hypothetical protein